VKNSNSPSALECNGKYPLRRTRGIRATLLFINFFLIILAYYLIKPARDSLFISALGAKRLADVWFISPLVLLLCIPFYNRIVARHSRLNIVMGTCILFGALLVFFRSLLNFDNPIVPFGFYIFIDIFSVVLVEQFWSLTNSTYSTREAGFWYGFLGTGGLAGGAVGSQAGAMLLTHTPLETPDMLLVSAALLAFIFILTWGMGRLGMYCEADHPVDLDRARNGWRVLRHSRYLLLIAVILMLAQSAGPVVGYQFSNMMESVYPQREALSAAMYHFYSLLNVVAIAVNLVITPFILNSFGAIGGMLVQPLLISICSWGFFLYPTLNIATAARIGDRGLSYSINRAAKEILYIPIDPVSIYQAKAWIDMFGYRIFKSFGSLLIKLFTGWLPFTLSIGQLSWLTMSICVLWIAGILVLNRDYRLLAQKAG
jgi:AAA family ATP:ADP antiporter